MATTHPSRVFASGSATTLYVTIPAAIVADSQFPFVVDDDITVTIEGDKLIVTKPPTGTDK